MLPRPPRAVLIDAGGVLLLPNFPFVSERFGIEAGVDRMREAFYVAFEQRDELVPEHIWLWRSFLCQMGLSRTTASKLTASVGEERKLFWHPPTAAPGGREFLEGLHRHDIPVAVVSNADGTVESMLKEAQVAQVGAGPGAQVAAIIDSTVVGVAKPDPRIFEIALARLRSEGHAVDAADVVHIGDALWSDVVGATAAGIEVMHLTPLGQCTHADHLDVRSLAHAARMLATESTPSIDRPVKHSV